MKRIIQKNSVLLQKFSVIFTFVIIVLFTLLQPFGAAFADPGTDTDPANTQDPGTTVVLEPGDVLDIKFLHIPELNETLTIRPDGKITLQLVDEVLIQGKTPAQVRDELVRLYSDKLQQTEITVIVREMPNRVVYVSGEVITPGVIRMPGRLTALEAIMQAGGFNMNFARMNRVMIIRHKEGKRQYFTLDLKSVLGGKKKAEKPFYLEPHDIVFVPR
jgi:protein involved in polysaccharide export with SLBB domain